MTMLSRVAERLYWTTRYLERAEDTARLIAAYNHLIMDLPRGNEPGWDILVRILDAEAQFYTRFRVPSEQNVLRFLIADGDSPSSIPHALRWARENVRTTRDVLPEDTWELVNELHLYAEEAAERSVGRRQRQQYLEEVVNRCQLINGLLASTLPRDHAYRFLKLGQLLERCDMTTRLIDVGVRELLGRDPHSLALQPPLWSALLQSLSALGAYRRMIAPVVDAEQAITFVFRESCLPRSVDFCLRGIREEIRPLHEPQAALAVVERARRKLARLNVEQMSPTQLQRYIDQFQGLLGELHAALSETWFRVRPQ